MFLKKKSHPAPGGQQLLISTANKYLGYTSELLGRNIFGQKVGYDAAPWSGAFVDVCAREAGLHLPSFTYVPTGLAECIKRGNISLKPQPGDIAIFNFPSSSGHAASAFSSPHCGIVTDVRYLSTNGSFLTIEGNTEGTGPHQKKDGVYQKVRFLTDVIVFCRPGPQHLSGRQLLIKTIKKLTRQAPDRVELQTINEAASSPEEVRMQMLRPNTRNRHIEIVQLALSQVTDLQGAERGKWDAATAAAYSSFQRLIGRCGSDVTGLPDLGTLQRLAKETGLFLIES